MRKGDDLSNDVITTQGRLLRGKCLWGLWLAASVAACAAPPAVTEADPDSPSSAHTVSHDSADLAHTLKSFDAEREIPRAFGRTPGFRNLGYTSFLSLADTGSADADQTNKATPNEGDLAKASQNPVGNMISLPFNNRTSFGIGPNDAKSNVLNIQPVYPVSLGKWNLINRAIVPVIYREEIVPGTGSASGLGDISYTGFFSPADPGDVIWGVGPSFLFPTATDDRFASDKFSAGVGVVALTMPKNWVVGVLAQNVWSVAGDDDAEDVNFLLLQPIINYNLNDGWYLTSVPVLTANWEADSSNRWTIPVGGGVGKIMRWGKQAVDMSIQVFYNVEHPEPLIAQAPNAHNEGSSWAIEVKLKFLFPK
jgi:hypothetical protein